MIDYTSSELYNRIILSDDSLQTADKFWVSLIVISIAPEITFTYALHPSIQLNDYTRWMIRANILHQSNFISNKRQLGSKELVTTLNVSLKDRSTV